MYVRMYQCNLVAIVSIYYIVSIPITGLATLDANYFLLGDSICVSLTVRIYLLINADISDDSKSTERFHVVYSLV